MFRGSLLFSALLFSVSAVWAADREVESNVTESAILDPASTRGLRLQYEAFTQEREIRGHHRLTSLQEEQNQHNRMRALGEDAIQSILRFQTDRGAQLVRTAARNHKDLRKPVPAAIIGALVVMVTGAPVEIFKTPETRLTARSRVSDQKGQLCLSTPVVDSSVDIANKAGENEDRYKIAVSRRIQALEASGELVYGSTSERVTASLDKQLSHHLSAAVASTRALNGDQSEESVRFNYRIQF